VSRRPALLLAAATLATAGGLLLASPAGALPGNPGSGATASGVAGTGRCAPLTSRAISGTLRGQDGRYLGATIGLDALDARGRKIDLRTGCPSGGAYAAVVQLNHRVGGQGAVPGSAEAARGGNDGGSAGDAFAFQGLPANVTQVFLETYVRGFTGSPCGLSCANPTTTDRYGWVNRRFLRPGTTGLRLVAPLTPRYGGGTGQIVVHTSAAATQVLAFCDDRDGTRKMQGWAIATTGDRRTWTLPALAGNQHYVIDVVHGGSEAHKEGVYVPVRRTVSVSFG